MKVLIVNIKVKRDKIEEFISATRENALASREEAGISRFDLLQDEEDSSRFALVEAYRDGAAQDSHRETSHYRKWKDLVEPMMAEPRARARYDEL